MRIDDLLDADLAEFAGAEIPDEWIEGEPVEAARDSDQADRLLRRVSNAQKEKGRIDAVASAEIRRINAWAADRLHGEDRRISYATACLEGFFRFHASEAHIKTLSLPNGTLALRAAAKRIEVEADTVLPAQFTRTRIEVDKAALAKRPTTDWKIDPSDSSRLIAEIVDENDICIPGVLAVKSSEDTFSAKAAGDDNE